MKGIEGLSDIALDALKEIGNIGAGNAATSLSELINRKIDMNVPKVNIVEFNRLEEVLGSADELVTGVFLTFTGDIEGTIMFVMDSESSSNMKLFFEDMTGKNDSEEFNDMEVSLFKETGNILAGSYLRALSDLTGLKSVPDIPLFAYDMMGAILSLPMIQFGQTGDKAMFIDSELWEDLKRVKAHFFIIPDSISYDKILNTLGIG